MNKEDKVFIPGVDFMRQCTPHAWNLSAVPILFCTNLLWFGNMHLHLVLNLLYFLPDVGAFEAGTPDFGNTP
jgi:hypothetical protein